MAGKRWTAFIGVMALALVLAACGGGSDKGASTTKEAPAGGQAPATQQAQAAKIRRGGTLRVALSGNPKSFDPKVYTDTLSSAVTASIYDTLVKVDENLVPQPWLAEKIEQPDELTYVFRLRQGVKFHDGTEMDAEAVKFSIDRIRENKAGVDYAEAQYIAESAVVDKYSYKAVLREPYSPFLVFMTGRPGIVVSPTAVKSLGEDKFGNNPVGTGPFKLVEWKNDNYVKVARFDGYWKQGADGKALPYLDAVEWRIITEPTSRLTALQTGDVDIAAVRGQDVDVVKKDPNLTLKQQVAASWSGLVLTITKPPFDNKALRQALAYAIDRDEIVRAIFEGNAEPSAGPMPPPHVWARDPNFKPYSYNPQKVKEKLAEGGKPNGFEFTAYFVADDSNERQLAELMQSQMAKVGIKMNVEFADFNGVVIPKARDGASNAYNIGFNCGYGDPDGCVSRRFLAGSGFNYMKYDNPQVNELILAARRTSNRDERGRLYKQVVPLIVDDAPFLFTTYPMDRHTGNKKVQGWYLGAKATAGYAEYWLAE